MSLRILWLCPLEVARQGCADQLPEEEEVTSVSA